MSTRFACCKIHSHKNSLKNGQLDSCGQDFDDTGKQIWDAIKGDYIFIKPNRTL